MKQCCEVDIMPSTLESEPTPTIERKPVKFKGAITEYSVFFVVSLICLSAGFVKQMTCSMLDYWETAGKLTLKPDYLTMLDIAPSAISIVGSFLLASIARFFGRKPALYVAAIFGIISGICFAYNDGDVICIFLARALSSVIITAAYMVCPLYMIEMVHDSTRGIFTAGCSFLIFGGMALSYTLEHTIPYPLFCAFLVIVPSTFTFLFFWLPESPYFLAFKKQTLKAERSLLWMRRQAPELIKLELAEITEMVKPESNTRPCCSLKNDSSVGMATALSLYILKTTGGIIVTRHVCELVCTDELITARDVHGIILTLKLISSFLGSLAADRAGRKMMLYFSYGGSCISFLMISVCISDKSESFRAVAMVCLCVFAIFYGLGYGTITPLVTLELTPVRSRCTMMAVAIVLESILSICLIVSHQPIHIVLGPPVNYIIPTVANALGVFFVWMVVPETSHKSLKVIQQIQIPQA